MKPTKEECLGALNELKYCGVNKGIPLKVSEFEIIESPTIEKNFLLIEQLIDEHFELIKAIEFIFGVKSEDVLKEYMEKCG